LPHWPTIRLEATLNWRFGLQSVVVGSACLSRGVRAFMSMSWNRILSGLIAATYVVIALCGGGAEAGFKVAFFLVLPLACIWFSEAMGGYTGPNWRAAITAPTPGVFVCIAGWLLLLLPAIVGIVYGLTGSKP
jgi:hypothetical protein